MKVKKTQDLLLIEDNNLIVKSLTIVLKQWNTNFKVAGTLQEVEAFLADNTFSIILADINLPDGNSIEYFSNKNLEKLNLQQSKIIYTTADKKIKKQHLLDASFKSKIWTKPFNIKKLKKQLEKNSDLKMESLRQTQIINELFNNDAALIAQVKKDVMIQVKQAKIEISECLERNDLAQAYQVAHKVKASLKLLQFNNLAKQFEAIEKWSLENNVEKVGEIYSKM